MTNRLDLHEKLCSLIGTRNVYFQPPETIKMNYPAIVYGLNNIENKFANDGVYSSKKSYLITVIDEDPDSLIVDKVATMSTCRFSRHFKSENLNHNVFTIYY